MLHIAAKAKLIGDVLAIELVVGRQGGALHSYDVPLDVLDAIIAALQRQRDDAHEFFRRAGVLNRLERTARKPRVRAWLQVVPPVDPHAEDCLPTPMLPPPMEKNE